MAKDAVAFMAIAIVLMGCAGSLGAAMPSMTIDEPEDGIELTTNLTTVMGTATNESLTWFQAGKMAFNPAVKDKTFVNATGLVMLTEGLSDDFNDNSFNTSEWNAATLGEINAHEKSGCLYLEGKRTTTGSWASSLWLTSTTTVHKYLKADLASFKGSGSGYLTCLFMYDDNQNYVGVGVQYEPDPWGSGLQLLTSAHINGAQHYNMHGQADGNGHTYEITYINGKASLYEDDTLIETITLNMDDPKVLITCAAKYYGNTVEAVWDNLTTGYPDGTLTSTIRDTRSSPPALIYAGWSAVIPASTDVQIAISGSDYSDMHSPTPWRDLTNGQTTGFPALRRYVQYMARLVSTDGISTPALVNVTLRYVIPVTKVEVRIEGDPNWRLAAGKARWSLDLTLPEDESNIWVKVTDASGDYCVTSVKVTVDTTAPVGTVLINGGDLYTGSTDVAVTLNATDRYGVARMRMANQSDLSGLAWRDYCVTYPWTLPSGDGSKAVYAMFMDVHGLVSGVVSDTIILDTISPLGSIRINDGAAYTNSSSVTLHPQASDQNGVVGMMVSQSPTFEGASWTTYAEAMDYVLLGGDGERTIYARFRDPLGHVSATVNATVIVDTRPPVLQLSINNGTAFTNSRLVSLGLTVLGPDAVTRMQLGEDPSFVGSPIETFRTSVPWMLAASEGRRFIYARAWDIAGNLGPVATASIILDTTPPVLVLIIDGGAAYTNERLVTLTVSAVEENGMGQVQFASDPGFPAARSEEFSPISSWTLAGDDGAKRVYVRGWDLAGNLGPTASASITLDTTPPVLSMSIDDGAAYTSSTGVVLSLTVVEANGLGPVELSESRLFLTSVEGPFGSRLPWNLSQGDGLKEVFARMRDVAGNMAEPVSASIILDTVGPSVGISLGRGSTYTRSWNVSLDIVASDASPIVDMRLGENPDLSTVASTPFATTAQWTFSPGDGTRSLCCAARDIAGNWGAVASDTIVLDTGAPSSNIMSYGPAEDEVEATLSWNASDALSGVGRFDVQYRLGEGAWVDWHLATCSTSATFRGERGRTYAFRVRASDGVGNTEPFPEDPAAFAYVTIPGPQFRLGSTLLWLIIIIVISAVVAMGYYLWTRGKSGG